MCYEVNKIEAFKFEYRALGPWHSLLGTSQGLKEVQRKTKEAFWSPLPSANLAYDLSFSFLV